MPYSRHLARLGITSITAQSITRIATLGPLGAAAATLDFTSIPQTYSALLLEARLRGDAAAAFVTVTARLNNDSGANYYSQWVDSTLAALAAGASNTATTARLGIMPGATAAAGSFGAVRLDLPGYADAFHKSGLMQTIGINGVSGGQILQGGGINWVSTAAITRVTLLTGSSNFDIGSSAVLWGLS